MIFSITFTPEFLPGTSIKTRVDQTAVHTRFAYWPSIASLQNGGPALVTDLLLPDGSPAISEGWDDGGNDYQMAVAPDCLRAYAGFVCKQFGVPGSTWNTYATRIDLLGCLVADVNGDQLVNSADAAAFGAAYVAATPLADVNHDGAVTPPDVVLFLDSFSCQCNPH